MLNWFAFLKGYVRIVIYGGSEERFLNLCSYKNILLWDVERREKGYAMCISLKAFFQLKPIARKTGTKVVIEERKGLPFFVPLLKQRKLFVFGVLFAILFWYLSAGFVWKIEVEGNYRLTEETLLSFLASREITVGTAKRKLDLTSLEQGIRDTFPIVTWTSARIDGTGLVVSIKENQLQKEETRQAISLPQDLLAGVDGTITSMIVRKGVPMVRIGQEVEADTVLVSGAVPITEDDGTVKEYLYVASDADIYISHEVVHQETIPAEAIRNEYTGREKSRFYLRFGEWEARLEEKQPYACYDTIYEEQTFDLLELFGIPLYFGRMCYREYQKLEYFYSIEEVKVILEEKMLHFFENLEEKGVHIIEKNVRIDREGEMWKLEAQLQVEEKALRKRAVVTADDSPYETEVTEKNVNE